MYRFSNPQVQPIDFQGAAQTYVSRKAMQAEQQQKAAEMKLRERQADGAAMAHAIDMFKQTGDPAAAQSVLEQLGTKMEFSADPKKNQVSFIIPGPDGKFYKASGDQDAIYNLGVKAYKSGGKIDIAQEMEQSEGKIFLEQVKDPTQTGGESEERYAVSQELDDLRGDVNIERAQYTNEIGLPREGMEKEYAEVEKRYAGNRNLLAKGVRNPRQYEQPIDAYKKLKNKEISRKDYNLILKTKFQEKVPVVEGSPEFLDLIKESKSPQEAERLAEELGYVIVPKEQVEAAENIQTQLDELVQ